MVRHSRLLKAFAILGPALAYLASNLPLFLAYLDTPNRHLTSWDQTLHIKDGYVFYLQLRQFDLLSFLYSFISLNFWLPLHPLIIAVTSFFTGFAPDVYVALNTVFIATGIGASSYLFFRYHGNSLSSLILGSGLMLASIRLNQSPGFLETHLNVMLESLGYGLTLVFGTAFFLELTEKNDQELGLTRAASISLSLLLFTKIQYGLFFAVAYFGYHLWNTRDQTFGAGGYWLRIWNTLRTKRVFLGFLILLNLFGLFALLTRNRYSHKGFGIPDGLWAHAFTVVLIATWIWRSKRDEVKALRNECPNAIGILTRYITLPFGWYYLFPFRNKIRWLLFNSSAPSDTPWTDQILIMPKQLLDFFSLEHAGTILILLGTAWILILTLRKDGFKPVFWPALMVALFYLPMTFYAAVHFPRLIITWIALIVALGATALARMVSSKTAGIPLVLALWTLSGALVLQVEPRKVTGYLTENAFLKPEHESVAEALKLFDFKQPGIIYGLGQSMDLSVPLYELEVIKQNPQNASLLPLSSKVPIIAHNLGKLGNQNPSEGILKLADDPKIRQILLFKKGFDATTYSSLSARLKNQNPGFSCSRENGHFELLQR